MVMKDGKDGEGAEMMVVVGEEKDDDGEMMIVVEEVVEEEMLAMAGDSGDEVIVDEVGEDEEDIRQIVLSERTTPCFMCNFPVRHPARHAITSHIPWYSSPEFSCFHCHLAFPQRKLLDQHINIKHTDINLAARFQNNQDYWVELLNALLREISRTLGLQYPDGLLDYMNSINFHHNKIFSRYEQRLAHVFVNYNNLPAVVSALIRPPANRKLVLHSFVH